MISILSIASISALGVSSEEIWRSYNARTPLFTEMRDNDGSFSEKPRWVSKLTFDGESALQQLQKENTGYKKLDRTVLLAIAAAKSSFLPEAFSEKRVGVNIGSSRGATALFEQYHNQYRLEGKVSAYASPTSTLGNISSWVGQELGIRGVEIEHSVTCSTAMHAMLNGIAWLEARMADVFLVGGSEAALTPFTFAQMDALKLYSRKSNAIACESMKFDKKRNSMVLGEGAAVAVLAKGQHAKAIGVIAGYGFASEKLEHGSSISENAACLQKSMKMALENAGMDTVDGIVMHAPGTVKGDMAELNAIDTVFNRKRPLLTSNKWLIGHTFGASGMMSVEMAVLMLQRNRWIENPFYNSIGQQKKLRSIMVNAVGFGGNAVSIIVSKP
ncbi:beta-ketoacyl synthase N-terminal-like domain-containing protein [Constantimarinum furrinae]|uniref:beta-ketoacyl synthase N-terminal-like domain-containing protein n=1 Tax=Constantimarinum furrinae TaxID=2562285 RepID=UPI001E65C74A|nr:beta-ketoacyl synthase N-terminal-like domain-containing protein [Constantimarinum furrinae]